MTTLAPITVDRERQCYQIEVTHDHGGKPHVYIALLKPDPKQVAFRTVEVRNKVSGRRITSDLQYLIGAKAVKRLFSSMYDKLRPLPQPKLSTHDRLEPAVILKLVMWQSEGRKHDPVTRELMREFRSCLRRINEDIADHHRDARSTKHPLGPYFQEIKRKQLVEMRRRVDMSDAMRDFCSEVLAQVYAWKSGKIPQEELEIIEKYRPGFQLMLA